MRGQVLGAKRHITSPAVIKAEANFKGHLEFGCEFWLLGRFEESEPRGALDELCGCDATSTGGECLDELILLEEDGYSGFFDEPCGCDDFGSGGVIIGLDFGGVGGS